MVMIERRSSAWQRRGEDDIAVGGLRQCLAEEKEAERRGFRDGFWTSVLFSFFPGLRLFVFVPGIAPGRSQDGCFSYPAGKKSRYASQRGFEYW